MEAPISSFFVGVPGGLIMSLIAFSIVFIVIVGLMLVMMGMKYLSGAIDSMGKKQPSQAPAAPAPAAPVQPQAAAPAPAPAAPAQAASADDEILAVITAAIAAACGPAARVISFSPVKAPAASAWKSVGRLQNNEGLF